MTEKLLPCPFCGGDSKMIVAHKPIKSVFIDCLSCDASGHVCETPQEAIAAWNHRAEQPAASAEPVGVMRESSEIGVAPYADIWGWLPAGTNIYAAPVAAKQDAEKVS